MFYTNKIKTIKLKKLFNCKNFNYKSWILSSFRDKRDQIAARQNLLVKNGIRACLI